LCHIRGGGRPAGFAGYGFREARIAIDAEHPRATLGERMRRLTSHAITCAKDDETPAVEP
jgi:hypothetical protein